MYKMVHLLYCQIGIDMHPVRLNSAYTALTTAIRSWSLSILATWNWSVALQELPWAIDIYWSNLRCGIPSTGVAEKTKAFVHVYEITHTHPYTYTHTHPYTYTPIHLHTYTPTHLYTYTPKQSCIHTNATENIYICADYTHGYTHDCYAMRSKNKGTKTWSYSISIGNWEIEIQALQDTPNLWQRTF